MQPKSILIPKLILMMLTLLCIAVFFILKIIFKEFILQDDQQKYALCSDYIREKYSSLKALSIIQDIQLILALALQIVLIAKCLYIIMKEKPQRIQDVADTNWLKVEFIMSKVIMTFLICFIASLISSIRQQLQCDTINTENLIIFLVTAICALLLKILLTAINFYLIYNDHSHIENFSSHSQNNNIQKPSQISEFLDGNQIVQQLQKLGNKNIFDMDSKEIRETLLKQHMMPDQQNPMDSFIVQNKFQKFHQNQQSISSQYLRKLKLKRSLLKRQNLNPNKGNIQQVMQEQYIPDPEDELDSPYNHQKVKEMNELAIEKLKYKGYKIQEHPYIQRTRLSKTFKTYKKQQPQNVTNRNPTQKSQQVQQNIEIVINLNTRQENSPYQCYTKDDLESIELDKIFYREYLQKEKQEKQQFLLKVLKNQKQMQLQMKLQNSQRLKCSYHQYIQEDRNIDKIYQQARLYASKKNQIDHFVIQELVFHLKAKSEAQLQGKILHDEINQFLKVSNEVDSKENLKKNQNLIRKRQRTVQGYSSPEKFKDRRNPIQLIRGKWLLHDS